MYGWVKGDNSYNEILFSYKNEVLIYTTTFMNLWEHAKQKRPDTEGLDIIWNVKNRQILRDKK